MSWYRQSQINKSPFFLADHLHRHLPDIVSAYNAYNVVGSSRTANNLWKPYLPQDTPVQTIRRIKPVNAPDFDGEPEGQIPRLLHKHVSKMLGHDMAGSSDLDNFSELGNEAYGYGTPFTGQDKVDQASKASYQLLSNWSSNYTDDDVNLAFQIAAQDVFGLHNAPIIHQRDKALYGRAKQLYEQYGQGMREFIKAQYGRTQDAFSSIGAEHVPVYRGYTIGHNEMPYLPSYLSDYYNSNSNRQHQQYNNVPISLQPLSSHTLHPPTAADFARNNTNDDQTHGIVHRIMVPRANIFSSPYTGYGEPDESEVLLLGGNNYSGDVHVIPYNNMDGLNSSQMSSAKKQLTYEAVKPWMTAYNRSSRISLSEDLQPEQQEMSPEELMTTRDSDQLGTNPGGFFLGADGQRRYLKFYRDPAQANSEHLANLVYRGVGIPAPKTQILPYGNKGQVMFASDDMGGEMAGLTPSKDVAQDMLKGFAADVLLANWDVLGLDGDNVTLHPQTGAVQRIDNGGALLSRGMGSRKNKQFTLNESEWETFSGQGEIDSVYEHYFNAAGVETPEQLGADIVAQIQRIEAYRQSVGGWRNFVETHARGLSQEDKDHIVQMLDARSNKLNARAQSIGR